MWSLLTFMAPSENHVNLMKGVGIKWARNWSVSNTIVFNRLLANISYN